MGEIITLEVKLHAFVRRETKSRWIATCPTVGVVSQGRTRESAKQSLSEAVELWFESCVERGVLDQAMREANFRAVPHGKLAGARARDVADTGGAGDQPADVRGELFRIHITIPAYQAAALNVA